MGGPVFQLREQDGDGSGIFPPSEGAIWGDSQTNYGIYGSSAGSASANLQATGTGVFGQNNTSGNGVVGYSESGTGVAGHSTSGYGVRGEGGDIGVYAQNLTTPGNSVYLATRGLAGDFSGDVAVSGNITVTGNVTVSGDVILPGADGMILDRQQSRNNRGPVALVGKVYCKVDAQYSPIEVGDLLTTSQTPGHAMKAIEPAKAFGAVIGKALRPLAQGQSLIPILIALQ